MLAFFVLVALSVVIIHQRTNSNDYETLQQLEKLPKTDYDERIDFQINNRKYKYNLIDEIDSVGFGKWKNIFKSYSSKECNLGEYIKRTSVKLYGQANKKYYYLFRLNCVNRIHQ
jgi:hypothetical protein